MLIHKLNPIILIQRKELPFMSYPFYDLTSLFLKGKQFSNVIKAPVIILPYKHQKLNCKQTCNNAPKNAYEESDLYTLFATLTLSKVPQF